jgi:small basic protein
VVLGAALTGMGASSSSYQLITIFGALNTIIAGIVAYLKSRGQPMRARMFRDDLDRVVDEMENSEIMWLGIQSGVHGYDEIAIDDSISVRSEVARLTRLYDKVVKNNTMNNRK